MQNFFEVQRALDTKGAAVSAQPLYVPGLTTGGKTRNVVYIATENAAVFAYDAGEGPVRILRPLLLRLNGSSYCKLASGNRCL